MLGVDIETFGLLGKVYRGLVCLSISPSICPYNVISLECNNTSVVDILLFIVSIYTFIYQA